MRQQVFDARIEQSDPSSNDREAFQKRAGFIRSMLVEAQESFNKTFPVEETLKIAELALGNDPFFHSLYSNIKNASPKVDPINDTPEWEWELYGTNPQEALQRAKRKLLKDKEFTIFYHQYVRGLPGKGNFRRIKQDLSILEQKETLKILSQEILVSTVEIPLSVYISNASYIPILYYMKEILGPIPTALYLLYEGLTLPIPGFPSIPGFTRLIINGVFEGGIRSATQQIAEFIREDKFHNIRDEVFTVLKLAAERWTSITEGRVAGRNGNLSSELSALGDSFLKGSKRVVSHLGRSIWMGRYVLGNYFYLAIPLINTFRRLDREIDRDTIVFLLRTRKFIQICKENDFHLPFS